MFEGTLSHVDAHLILTFTTALAYSAIDKLMIFFLFFPENRIRHFMQIVSKTRFDFLCKLSPMETICINCQILFPGKNKKNISICCLLNFFTQQAKH